MRSVAATIGFFAPEIEVIAYPAWDCLPYDRASPTLRIMAERLAALHRLQAKPKGPQLLVTTANAAIQRTLTPFRVRQLVARLAPGERIGRDKVAALLSANGYVRTDTVHDQGEFAVRGGLVDLFPSGEEQALRLDFFGDEIESVRTFDPSDQRTTGRVDGFTLLPASEALLDDESIKRFRARYRETFGATATGDPLIRRSAKADGWPGWSIGCRCSRNGWRPFSTISATTRWWYARQACPTAAEHARAITDYHGNRVRAQSGDPGSPSAPRRHAISDPRRTGPA